MSTAPESPPLPPLQDALIDLPTLAQLARDLRSFAQVDEVLLKGGSTEMTAGARVALDEALEALREGRVLGVQIRYRYDGSRWWDTLLRTARGIRLVRIEHPLEG